ncbi:MAG: C25 family peptidase propeptide domain-containing protein, partial [Bacteroidales bacterium]|nr:C25 family peptidase propeptide domain-containing protein [Bacteroidales bacterium]
MKSHIYLILVFLIVSSSLKSQISHKVSFTEKELTFEKVLGENKQEYMKVNYSGLSSQGIEGTPELPIKYIKVRVPVMANNISITIEKITKQNIPLSAGVYPAQPDIPMSSLQPFPFVDREPAVYNSDNGFPNEIVSIVGNGYLLGNIHIIDLAISPVVYYPKENRLELNSEISFRINYSVSEMASKNEGMLIINRKSGKNINIDLNNMVVNPDFKEPAINTGSSISTRSISSISLPVYEYVVITNEALKPCFNRLISWKRTKGYNAGVVTMEEILADNGITGDPASTYALNDSAGKLRQYLTYAEELGTNYVLLGGIGSIVPFRFGSGKHDTWLFYN